jgi:hypothetical protein
MPTGIVGPIVGPRDPLQAHTNPAAAGNTNETRAHRVAKREYISDGLLFVECYLVERSRLKREREILSNAVRTLEVLSRERRARP